MRKTTFLTGFAAGYVLGARAGVERYEQIKSAYAQLRGNPKVQDVVEQAQAQAGSIAAEAKDKVSESVSQHRSKDDADDDGSYDVAEGSGTYAQAGSNGRLST